MFVRYRRYNKRCSCPWTLVELLTVRWKFFPIRLFLFYFRSWQTWPHQSISDSQQLQTSSKVLTVSLSVLSKPYLWSPLNVYIYWLYLGFIVWERSPEWPKATSFLGWSGGIPPRSFFEINMCRDAIWCIFERRFWEMLQCVHWPRQVWMIFPICLLVYCNDTIFFLGGGSFYPSNTLDRTLYVKLFFTLSSMNNKG